MKVTATIDASTFVRLEKMAKSQNKSFSKFIGEAVESFFAKAGSPYPKPKARTNP